MYVCIYIHIYMSIYIYTHTYTYIREGNGTPLQYSCLENPMDGGAWWAVVHGIAKSWTRLSDFTFTFHSHALEKEMATHSSVLAWWIPGTEEPGRLPSLGSHRVRHDWSNLAAATHIYVSPNLPIYPTIPLFLLGGSISVPSRVIKIFLHKPLCDHNEPKYYSSLMIILVGEYYM